MNRPDDKYNIEETLSGAANGFVRWACLEILKERARTADLELALAAVSTVETKKYISLSVEPPRVSWVADVAVDDVDLATDGGAK